MKYCRDCKYFWGANRFIPYSQCMHNDTRDYTGRMQRAFFVREHGLCGPDAALFEPEPPKKPGFWTRLFHRDTGSP